MEMYDNVMLFNNELTETTYIQPDGSKEEEPAKTEDSEDFSYKGYEVVRGAFFAHLFEPSVKLVKETVSVNAACIRKLPDRICAVSGESG